MHKSKMIANAMQMWLKKMACKQNSFLVTKLLFRICQRISVETSLLIKGHVNKRKLQTKCANEICTFSIILSDLQAFRTKNNNTIQGERI